MIDEKILDTKWNDWSSDSLYLWNGDTLYVAKEGDGSNLDFRDKEAGWHDYWYTEVYAMGGDGAIQEDGGIWLERELIMDHGHTIRSVIDRLMECDLWADDWQLLDAEQGDRLQGLFDETIVQRAKSNQARRNVEQFIAGMKGEER